MTANSSSLLISLTCLSFQSFLSTDTTQMLVQSLVILRPLYCALLLARSSPARHQTPAMQLHDSFSFFPSPAFCCAPSLLASCSYLLASDLKHRPPANQKRSPRTERRRTKGTPFCNTFSLSSSPSSLIHLSRHSLSPVQVVERTRSPDVFKPTSALKKPSMLNAIPSYLDSTLRT